jgi:hypothetical protein
MDYTAFLKINKKKYMSESLFGNHLFLKYPILVKDRELFFINARENKIIFGGLVYITTLSDKRKFVLVVL